MKESIGSTASLNIALAFIAIVFAFLAATLSYYKAFKVNNIISNAIEKYEGFNELSINEINEKLSSIGYERFSNCPQTKQFDDKDYNLVTTNNVDGICIYFYNDAERHVYQYGIVTYMTINLPIVSEFINIPVNTISEEIYGCYGINDKYGETPCGS